MARSVGAFIKDLRYDKFYVIVYKWRDQINILSETNNRLTFTDIVPLPFNKRMTIGVVKFKTEQEAKNMILKIPIIEIAGYEVEYEIYFNAYNNDWLVGV